MNGVHDMGGMHGFGPVEREEDEPVFHAPWEGRVYGMANLTLATRMFVVDQMRHAVERIPPAQYLAASYYERWLLGLTTLLLEAGVVTRAELAGAEPARPLDEPVQAVEPDAVGGVVMQTPDPESARIQAGFEVGDSVMVRNLNHSGHCRVPGYAKGKRGRIELDHGIFDLPDALVAGQLESKQHCYCVSFASRELWGEGGNANDRISLDLWEDYLAPA